MIIVNMTEFFPYAWILHLARALIVYNITHCMLRDRRNAFVSFAAVVGGCMLISGVGLTIFTGRMAEYEFLFSAMYIALFTGIVCLVYEGKILHKILASLLAECAQMGGSFVYAILSQKLIGASMMRMAEYEMLLLDLLADALFIFAFSFIFTLMIRLVQKKAALESVQTWRTILFYIFPVTHLACAIISFIPYQILSQFDLNNPDVVHRLTGLQTMVFSVLTICFVVDIALLFVIDHIQKVEQRNIENEKQILQANMNFEQVQMLREEKTEFRKIRHDMANLLTTAVGFIEIGKPEKAEEILRDAGNTVYEVGGMNLCSNETINTIVYIKQQYAAAHGVKLTVSVEESAPVKVSDYDLCRLLHNLLDNALHAAENSSEKTADFTLRVEPDTLTICGSNAVSDAPARIADGHGYGTEIIREIVKAHAGQYTVEQTRPQYRTRVRIQNAAVQA